MTDTTDPKYWQRGKDPHRHRVAMHWAQVLYDAQQREQGHRAVEAHQRWLDEQERKDQLLRRQCEAQAFDDYDNSPDTRAHAERLYAIAVEQQHKKPETFKEFISKFSAKE